MKFKVIPSLIPRPCAPHCLELKGPEGLGTRLGYSLSVNVFWSHLASSPISPVLDQLSVMYTINTMYLTLYASAVPRKLVGHHGLPLAMWWRVNWSVLRAGYVHWKVGMAISDMQRRPQTAASITGTERPTTENSPHHQDGECNNTPQLYAPLVTASTPESKFTQ